jgi:hypothetical protein
MQPEVRVCTRRGMMKRVASFGDLNEFKSGLPDSELPECERELINVTGFQPPSDESKAVSAVGSAAARLVAIPISEGFNLGFVRCKPERGPLMPNHNTNQTFMVIMGRWRRAWNKETPTNTWMWALSTPYPSHPREQAQKGSPTLNISYSSSVQPADQVAYATGRAANHGRAEKSQTEKR